MAAADASGARMLRPLALALCAMMSFQLGGSLAKLMFPAVGANGTTTLRLTLSALILCVFTRPWRAPMPRGALAPLLVYGAALAGVNGFFYLAIRTVPIGVSVTIDFLGPLAVAVLFSRRPLDLLWVAMAGCGVVLLLPVAGGVRLDPAGLAFSVAAAASWAVYILSGRRLGALMPNGRAVTLGIAIGALLMLPFGFAEAGSRLLSPELLPLAITVAIVSSALPNILEMMAMTRLPAGVFGVLMSLEPAFGALFGFVLWGEHLNARQLLAIALVILASAGVTVAATRVSPAPV
jgi:inner membrane transporter RhtA